jgi:hypothetical protein
VFHLFLGSDTFWPAGTEAGRYATARPGRNIISPKGVIKGSVNENVILSIASDRVIGLAICSAEQYKKIR